MSNKVSTSLQLNMGKNTTSIQTSLRKTVYIRMRQVLMQHIVDRLEQKDISTYWKQGRYENKRKQLHQNMLWRELTASSATLYKASLLLRNISAWSAQWLPEASGCIFSFVVNPQQLHERWGVLASYHLNKENTESRKLFCFHNIQEGNNCKICWRTYTEQSGIPLRAILNS
jgi:hypothetical protein